MGTRTGTVQTGDPRAEAQAAAIGATIHPDGWWYVGNKRLTPEEADTLAKQKGAAISGLDFKGHGLGKGTLGDITGGRIGDVHIPPAVADALRMAAEVGGQLVGIPPQVTGAIVNNIGRGSIGDGKGGIDWGQAAKRGAVGAIQGATVGGATQGIQNLGSKAGPNLDTLMAAGKGGLKGMTNPMGSYTGNAAAAAGSLPPIINGNQDIPGINGPAQGSNPGGLADASQPFTTGGASDPGGDVGSSSSSWLDKIPGVKDVGSLLGSAGSFLTGNGGLNALGLAQGANAALLGKQSSDYAKGALKSATDAYDAKAPLRAQGIAGMQAPKTADLSALSKISKTGNPFAVGA